jgi:hypothetical protein
MVQSVCSARDKIETPPGTPDIVTYHFASTLLGYPSRLDRARQGIAQTPGKGFVEVTSQITPHRCIGRSQTWLKVGGPECPKSKVERELAGR